MPVWRAAVLARWFSLKTDSRQDAPPVRVFALLARSLASATCFGAKGADKMLKGPLEAKKLRGALVHVCMSRSSVPADS